MSEREHIEREHIQITAQAVAKAIAIERERCVRLIEEYVCSTGHLGALVDMIRNPDQNARRT